ncbi:hypothetical protein ELI_3881 [Eubacterium callanderi]|uniref:Uncharacterized protein n=1 Tax=Eubacterium callanderi TaxID=53442 RepID=E3GGM0_9FIRM|nr:hypothetical protein ELI_3881 [Eubacterium callanderi]
MFCQALFKIYFLNFSSAGLKALRCCTLRDSLLSIPRTLPFVKRFLTFILIFFDFILTWTFYMILLLKKDRRFCQSFGLFINHPMASWSGKG